MLKVKKSYYLNINSFYQNKKKVLVVKNLNNELTVNVWKWLDEK